MQKWIAALAVVWTVLLGIIALVLSRIADAGTFVCESTETKTDAQRRTTMKPAIELVGQDLATRATPKQPPPSDRRPSPNTR